MADRRHRLPLRSETPDQSNDVRVSAQLVGIANSAGQDQRVEVRRPRLIDGQVGADRLAGIVVDGRLDRVAGQRRKDDLRAAFAEEIALTEKLPFLEAVCRQDQNP
jgi:hypothetical protein